jgi:phosphomannomutase
MSDAVAIGFDGRKGLREFARLCSRVLRGNRLQRILSDEVVPTPVLSYSVHAERLAAGIMITASDNPPQYNGVKFKGSYGSPFLTDETKKVEALIGHSPVRESQHDVQPSCSLATPYGAD